MQIKIDKRSIPSRWVSFAAYSFSIAVALLLIAFVFSGLGVSPFVVYRRMFIGAFGSRYGLTETIVKAIPLMICGVGLALSFKAQIWNIGAEGQLLIGAVGATWVALYGLPNAPAIVLVPAMFAAGFLGGALWGLIPGFLKAKYRMNEVITSLMMVYIASELVNHLVYGPWKGPEEWGFPHSSKFPSPAWLPRLFGTRIHYPTLVMGLGLALLTYLLVTRTKLGYEIRITGGNPEAARYAGVSYFKIVILAMLFSGGLAGLAGVGEMAGIHHRLRYPEGISSGYGFTSIIVAWLGQLNPLAVILTSILFGGLLVGGDALKVLGFPGATVDLLNGTILLFVLGGDFLTRHKISLKRKDEV